MKQQLREVAFGVARSRFAGAVTRAAFQFAPWVLPLKTVRRGTLATVYEHPKPAYESHLLVVPSRGIQDLFSLAHPNNAACRTEMWQLKEWAFGEYGSRCALINAGARQDVAQVHMHLSSQELDMGGTNDIEFATWDEAVLGLHSVPMLDSRLRSGMSLVQTMSNPAVRVANN